MGTLMQDVRYGLRMLAKSPGFTLIAVLTLALGIGANSAMFSVLDAVLLRPLPYPQPGQLMQVYMRFTGIGIPNDENAVSAPEFRDVSELSHSFSAVAAYNTGGYNLSMDGAAQRVTGASVSPSFFPMLGTQPALGRLFRPDEAKPGHDGVLLLANGIWKRKFGGNPAIVGRVVQADGKAYVVIGVLPAGFYFPDQSDVEIWTPLAFTPDDLSPDSRGNHGLNMLARLKPGVSLEQARAEMDGVSQRIIEQNPKYPYRTFNFKVLLTPLLEDTVGDVRAALWILLGAVGFVLLIACANIATLFLIRASAREKETAIRLALGATTGRLLRQWVTEGLLVGLLGGLAGLCVVPWALSVLAALASSSVPRVGQTKIDLPIVFFTIGLSLLVGILIGFIPALQSARSVKSEALKEGGYTGSSSLQAARTRRFLVAGEIALALILLTGGGLLLRSFMRVLAVDPGFRSDSVLTMRIALPDAKYSKDEQVRAFYQNVLERVRGLPGVEQAGAINRLPLTGSNSGTVTVDSHAVPADQTTPEADFRSATPGYFEAAGIRLLKGRLFTSADTDTSAPVAIIDDTMAQTYWPGEGPIGKRIKQGDDMKSPWNTIVGVVGHVHYRTLEAHSRVEVYWPETQHSRSMMSLVIRTQREPLGMAPDVEKAILAVDPEVPAFQVRTLQDVLSDSVARRRFAVILLALFSAMALLLAALGIYGAIAYSVAQRYREIGIRMSLGAQPPDVLRMILREGLVLALQGIAAGLAGALIVTQLLSGLLFSVHPADPLTFTIVGLLLAATALLACFLPATRAMRTDPMVALRYE